MLRSMPRVFVRVVEPPPFLPVVGGTATTTVTLPQVAGAEEPPSSSTSSSLVIVIIIIASAIIVSASLYLLIRFISRHCHHLSLRTFSSADDVDVVIVSSLSSDLRRDRFPDERKTSPNDLINALPLFTFSSVNGKIAGGDCAVCLSKFEHNDQLRLLPLCCHAFHAQCIDAWLSSNQTCPLCRSTVHPTEADVFNKIISPSAPEEGGNSFRIEIGSLSSRRGASDSADGRRTYSVGSFDYIVDDGFEVPAGSMHQRGISVDKESTGAPVSVPAPPGESVAAEVAGRSWLRDYVDRIASISSRTVSFRSSGRFFTGSSRRSDIIIEDLEANPNRVGEEISELFRWLSGV